MNEGLVYVCDIVSTFTFIFLIQEIIVGFNIGLCSDYAWSLLREASLFRGDLVEFSDVVDVVLRTAEHHHAWLGAEHDWNADEYEHDQHLRNLFLTVEKEHIRAWIPENKLLVTSS